MNILLSLKCLYTHLFPTNLAIFITSQVFVKLIIYASNVSLIQPYAKTWLLTVYQMLCLIIISVILLTTCVLYTWLQGWDKLIIK